MKIIQSPFVAGLLGLFAFTATAQSRVLTVDNNAGAVAMFKNFGTAYAAAQPGDTLLLAGSEIHYEPSPGVHTKRIHIVGNGHSLAENNIPGLSKRATRLRGITFDSLPATATTPGSTADGSTLTGVEIDSLITSVGIVVDRCKIHGTASDALSGGQRKARPIDDSTVTDSRPRGPAVPWLRSVQLSRRPHPAGFGHERGELRVQSTAVHPINPRNRGDLLFDFCQPICQRPTISD